MNSSIPKLKAWVKDRDVVPPSLSDRKYEHHKVKQRFYKSFSWCHLKSKIYNHYGKKCMKCGNKGRSSYIQVDHIKSFDHFPESREVFDNLQVLCIKCRDNKSVEQRYENVDYRPENLVIDHKVSCGDGPKIKKIVSVVRDSQGRLRRTEKLIFTSSNP